MSSREYDVVHDRPGTPGGGPPSEESPILNPRDHMGIARAFIDLHCKSRSDLRTLQFYRGVFWSFDKGCYRALNDSEVRAMLWKFLERARSNESRFFPDKTKVANVLEAVSVCTNLNSRLEPPVWISDEEQLPDPKQLLAVSNGLLHLPSGDLYPQDPRLFTTSASDVAYDPSAAEPENWLRFLDDLLGADTEAREAIQDWYGYCLSPDTSLQKMFLVVGPTRSGKGTLAKILTELVGKLSMAGPSLLSLATNFGVEALTDKTLAIVADARLSGRSDQAPIVEKLLSISGEDTITIDRKFRPAWTGRLPTRFMLMTNELPNLTDSSAALTRRFVVIVLKNSFYGREDRGLFGRLHDELPAILNWARVGYLRISERGSFVQPASATDSIEHLATLASPVIAFVKDRCELGPGFQSPVSTIYGGWRAWCEENGRREPGTVQTFGRNLHAAFPHIKAAVNVRTDDGRARVYEGIRLS